MKNIWTFEINPGNQDSNIVTKEKLAKGKLFYSNSTRSLIIGNFKVKEPIK